MRRILGIGLSVALVMGAMTGCGDEAPTEVGSDLLGEGLRTVEVVLEATDFLQGDTTYDAIGNLNQAGYGIAAHSFQDDLEANFLFKIARPYLVSYTDTAGGTNIDSLAAIRGGTVTVVLDTLAKPVGPIDLAVVQVLEDWDPFSVSWTLRSDTGGVAVPWTTVGGTTGDTLGRATWESGDTILIPIDSATASVWHDTIAAVRGGALKLLTPDRRIRIQSIDFSFNVVPTGMDTILPAGEVNRVGTLASPDTTDPGAGLRVGGLPVWRSMLHFLPLADLQVPCESQPTTCTIALSEVRVNTANLLLQTQPVAGRRIERSMRLEARAVLEGPDVPLTRLPLSRTFGRMTDTLSASAFSDTLSVAARVPVTDYVQRNVDPGEGEETLLWLALTAESEKGLFGYGQFGGVASAVPPKLQLVVTIPVRKVDP